jgi:hypothetical protein
MNYLFFNKTIINQCWETLPFYTPLTPLFLPVKKKFIYMLRAIDGTLVRTKFGPGTYPRIKVYIRVRILFLIFII